MGPNVSMGTSNDKCTKRIVRCRFLAIVDVIRFQHSNGSKRINGYVIRHVLRQARSGHAMSYDSYQAKHGEATYLTVAPEPWAATDRGAAPAGGC